MGPHQSLFSDFLTLLIAASPIPLPQQLLRVFEVVGIASVVLFPYLPSQALFRETTLRAEALSRKNVRGTQSPAGQVRDSSRSYILGKLSVLPHHPDELVVVNLYALDC